MQGPNKRAIAFSGHAWLAWQLLGTRDNHRLSIYGKLTRSTDQAIYPVAQISLVHFNAWNCLACKCYCNTYPWRSSRSSSIRRKNYLSPISSWPSSEPIALACQNLCELTLTVSMPGCRSNHLKFPLKMTSGLPITKPIRTRTCLMIRRQNTCRESVCT